MPPSALKSLAIVMLLASSHAGASEPAFVVTREGATVKFQGEITAASATALNKHIDDGVRMLEITSVGGDAVAAMSVAYAMRRHRVAINVPSYCFSSCANYLFLAAAEKSLSPTAILGFHGGVHTGGKKRTVEGGAASIEGAAQLEKIFDDSQAFYDAIEFDVSLLDWSGDLTKLPRSEPAWELLAKDGKKYSFAKNADVAAKLAELLDAKNFKSLSMKSTSASMAYFPDRTALESCGVSNITRYAYPASRNELAAHAARIAPNLKVIGDFRGADEQPGFACPPRAAATGAK